LDKIDKIAESIGKQSELIRKKYIDFLIDDFTKTGNLNQTISKIASTNITEQILEDFGLGKELNKALALYPSIANEIKDQLGKIDPIMTKNLNRFDESYIFNHVRDVGNNLTRGLAQSVLDNFTPQQFRNYLMQNTTRLADYNINALVNTTLRDYSRSVFADSARKYLPKTARYRYVGPSVQEDTHEGCKIVMSDPQNSGKGYTLDEISSLPVGLTSGGGFNCRRTFELIFDSVKDDI